MSYMFHSGSGLYKEINLASFDTSNVEDMSYMFATIKKKIMINIDPIDFSRFNTSKVKNMEGMFSGSFLPSLNSKILTQAMLKIWNKCLTVLRMLEILIYQVGM